MAQATLSENPSIDYYATTTGTPKIKTPGQEEVDDSAFETIATVKLSNASVGTKYHCQGKYTITSEIKDATSDDQDISTDKGKIAEEDGKLYLKTTEVDGVTVSIKNDKAGSPDESGTNSINHDIKSLLTESKTFWVTYDFIAKSSDISGTVAAAFKISNRDDDQNYLANKKITVTITPDATSDKLTCEIQKAEE